MRRVLKKTGQLRRSEGESMRVRAHQGESELTKTLKNELRNRGCFKGL